ncbi:MAG: YihY/virulence factor BrkB family protein [Solirubrobacteraceae bacterium]
MAAIPLSRDDARDVVESVVEGFRRHRLNVYAAAIAFRVLVAVIPFSLFVLGLVGLLDLSDLWIRHVGPWVQERASIPLFNLLDDTVNQVLRHRQVFWVTAGFALTLWEVSAAVRATMEALDRVYEVRRRRPWRVRMAVSLALGALVGALMLGALAVLAIGGAVVGGGLSLLWRVPLAALLLGGAVWATVRWAPSKRRPVRWVSFGSATTIIAWLVCAGGYALWVTQISSVGSAFASLTAAFVLMVFLYVSSIAFMVGVVIDASVREEATGGTA